MNLRSLLLGDLLSMVLLGADAILMKLSMREGSSVPNYLVQVGGTVLVVGHAHDDPALKKRSACTSHDGLSLRTA